LSPRQEFYKGAIIKTTAATIAQLKNRAENDPLATEWIEEVHGMTVSKHRIPVTRNFEMAIQQMPYAGFRYVGFHDEEGQDIHVVFVGEDGSFGITIDGEYPKNQAGQNVFRATEEVDSRLREKVEEALRFLLAE
jgi:hypothetical protein